MLLHNNSYFGCTIRSFLYNGTDIEIPKGTILIEHLYSIKIFFELNKDWSVKPGSFGVVKDMKPMEAVPGSVISEDGCHMTRSIISLPDYVRIPTIEELLWYHKQNVV